MRPAASDAPCFTAGWEGRDVSLRLGRPARRPDRTGATSKTGHPNSLSCPGVRAQLKLQSSDGKYYHNRFSQTPKPHHTTPEPQIPHPHTRPHSATRRQPQTAAGWRPKTPQENAKSRPSRCAGVSGRPERFRRRHPKAHPDSGRPDQ